MKQQRSQHTVGLRGQECGKNAVGTMEVVRISRKRILLAGGRYYHTRTEVSEGKQLD